jgi:hypothetical protein
LTANTATASVAIVQTLGCDGEVDPEHRDRDEPVLQFRQSVEPQLQPKHQPDGEEGELDDEVSRPADAALEAEE